MHANDPTIIHVDMDAFFAAVEQQVNPALKGKPVIIGGRNYKYRSIICAASYEAKALGIGSAMPSWQALKICPQAVFVPADTPKYIYTSNQIFEILKTFSPQVEKFSVDEFFLDVAGCERLLGNPEVIGQKIKDKIKARFGLTCTVGIAPTRMAAKLAAKSAKPDGLKSLTKENALMLLKDLPIEKICGIGSRLKRRFNRLGIETCGQLSAYPENVLRAHFGVMGLWLKAACRVEDIGSIEFTADSNAPPKSVGHSQTLRETTDDQQYIKSWIYLLSEMVARRLRRKNLQGKTIHFYVCDAFSNGFAKQKTFQEPSYDGYEIYQRCLKIIDLLGIQVLVARVLGISVSGLSRAEPHHLFEKQLRRERLMTDIDRINGKHGEWTLYPAALKEAEYEKR